MTDENEIPTQEESSTTNERVETTEETARAVFEELKAGKYSAEEGKDDAKAQDGEKPAKEAKGDIDPSAAGRALAFAKKHTRTKRRQTFVPASDAGANEAGGHEAGGAGEIPTDASERADKSKPVLQPPQHFPVPLKEHFNKLPREFQERALEMFSGLEKTLHPRLQEATAMRERYAEVDQVMNSYGRPYQRPWNKHGFSDGQFIAESAAMWEGLRADPLAKIAELAAATGISGADIDAINSGQAPQQRQVSQPNMLTAEQVRAILKEEQMAAQREAMRGTAKQQVEALMNETDQNGSYVYPELWDASYRNRVQLLVDHHLASQPGITYGEATKRAVLTDRASRSLANGNPGTNPASRSSLTPQEIQAAKQASTPIRSRANGALSRVSTAKPGETNKESATASYYEFFGNRN